MAASPTGMFARKVAVWHDRVRLLPRGILANDVSGVPADNRPGRHILGHHRRSRHNRAVPDRDAFEDDRPRAHPRVVANDDRRSPDAADYFMRVVIPDHHLRANQAIVANDDLGQAGDVAAPVDVPGPQPELGALADTQAIPGEEREFPADRGLGAFMNLRPRRVEAPDSAARTEPQDS